MSAASGDRCSKGAFEGAQGLIGNFSGSGVNPLWLRSVTHVTDNALSGQLTALFHRRRVSIPLDAAESVRRRSRLGRFRISGHLSALSSQLLPVEAVKRPNGPRGGGSSEVATDGMSAIGRMPASVSGNRAGVVTLGFTRRTQNGRCVHFDAGRLPS